LGEFGIDNFNNGPQSVLCYFFFILATLLTQVTALNMIIAIMGDTYGRVSEGYEMHSREMKISLLSDYVPIIRQDSDANSQPHDNFLVVITAVDDTNEKKEWEGSINAIRKVIDA
jgi:mRNA deadenylase 3'-5' endonuclease subunit Ccr4